MIGVLVVLGFAVWAGDFQEMTVPGGDRAVWSDLYVNGDALMASWIEQQGRHEGQLKVAVMKNGVWSEPVVVTDSKKLFINWADFPKLAASDNEVLVAWPQMVGEGRLSYALMYAFSTDGGKSFSKAMPLQDDMGGIEHGFVSLRPTGKGGLRAVWIDGPPIIAGNDEIGTAAFTGLFVQNDFWPQLRTANRSAQ